MSELTTVARPYAIAAFRFCCRKQCSCQWLETITFAAQVAANE